MSIADLKMRMADVPGIHTLSMALQAGRIVLHWAEGRYSAAVGAAASDSEIETAIRNAVKLPPVSMIPDKPAQTGQTMSDPASSLSAIDTMMAEHVATMKAVNQAQLALLKQTLENQAQSVTAGFKSVTDKINSQTADFESMMARYTNAFGAG